MIFVMAIPFFLIKTKTSNVVEEPLAQDDALRCDMRPLEEFARASDHF